jgi:hypothetical protein
MSTFPKRRIGDVHWAGWDYLGEAGSGMWEYGKKKGALYK